MATWILEHAGTGPVSESFESCGGKQFVFTSKKGLLNIIIQWDKRINIKEGVKHRIKWEFQNHHLPIPKVLSLEVAEHIPRQFETSFLKNLDRTEGEPSIPFIIGI